MQKRDLKMDIFKGILVIGMVYCHVLQFFVKVHSTPLTGHVIDYINVTTFAGFVFTFGYTSQITYFSKTCKAVYMKIFAAFFKLLAAFYLSGLSFRVFVDHQPITKNLVMNILLLNDIPGWSEFIIAFALYVLVAGLLFWPIKKMVEIKWLFWLVVPLLLLTTLIPYEKVTFTQLGLWIGTTKFAAFPVLQFMPLYLLGVYFKRYEIGLNKWLVLGATMLSGVGLYWMAAHDWQMPGRFPPSAMWLMLPMLPLMIYYVIGFIMEKYNRENRLLLIMGRNSMVYVLLSNVFIFALSGVRGVMPLNNVTGLIGCVLLLAVITYLVQMTRPLPKMKQVATAAVLIMVVSLSGCGNGEKTLGKLGQETEINLTELAYTIHPDQFYQNPQNISQIGDPFVLKASDGNYYCYPTSDAGQGFKVWVSKDLVSWEKADENAYHKTSESWAKSDFWAPEVYEWDGQFYMYYTARWKESNTLKIGVAVSDSPLGPFKDVSNQPMFDYGYAVIDANVFVDEDGQGYLYYVRDCSENDYNGNHESHIYGVKLSTDKTQVVGEPVLLTKPEQAWETASGEYRWNEGPFVLKHEDTFYLMYSVNYYADRNYSIGYATSTSPLGSFTKSDQNPLVYTQSDWKDISGPGHHSVTTSPDGQQLYMVYHTHSVAAIGGGDRQVNVDAMGFREDGSIYINGPSTALQLKPEMVSKRLSTIEMTHNDEKTDVLSDGEIALHTEGSTKTPVVSLTGKDLVAVTFQQETSVTGIVLYSVGAVDTKLKSVKVVFSNGSQISELNFAQGVGTPAIAQFEPMKIKWMKIYNVDEKSTTGSLSEVIVLGE